MKYVFALFMVALTAACGQQHQRANEFQLSASECLKIYGSCTCSLTAEEKAKAEFHPVTYGDFAVSMSESSLRFPGDRDVTADEVLDTFEWRNKKDDLLPEQVFCVPSVDDFVEIGPPSAEFIADAKQRRKSRESEKKMVTSILERIDAPTKQGVYIVQKDYSLKKVQLSGEIENWGGAIVSFQDLPEKLKIHTDSSDFEDDKVIFECMDAPQTSIQRVPRSDLLGIYAQDIQIGAAIGLSSDELKQLPYDGNVWGQFCLAPITAGRYGTKDNQSLFVLSETAKQGDVVVVYDGGPYRYLERRPAAVLVVD